MDIFTRLGQLVGRRQVQLPATGRAYGSGAETVAVSGGVTAEPAKRPRASWQVGGSSHGAATTPYHVNPGCDSRGDASWVGGQETATWLMSRDTKQLILILADGSPSMEALLAGVSRGISSLVSGLAPVANQVRVAGVVWSDTPRLVVRPTQVDRFSLPGLGVQGGSTQVVPAARAAIQMARAEYDLCARSGVRRAPTLLVWFSDMRFTDNIAEVAAEIHQAETSGLISSYAVKYGTDTVAAKAEKHRRWMATLAPQASQRFETGESTDFGEILGGVGERSFTDVTDGRANRGVAV